MEVYIKLSDAIGVHCMRECGMNRKDCNDEWCEVEEHFADCQKYEMESKNEIIKSIANIH